MRDTAGFDAFYAATSRRVLQHAYAVCGDAGEAQDIVQEAYARAWQRWPRISEYDNPEAWVRTVAWRLAANRLRNLRRRMVAMTRMGTRPPAGEPSPDGVAIAAALRHLPMRQRHAVVLHYLCDLPVADVAVATGAPVGTVKVWLSRARTTLAGLLHDAPEEA
jgi:RNA polymerase sigma-70 factor, ECF subfamily